MLSTLNSNETVIYIWIKISLLCYKNYLFKLNLYRTKATTHGCWWCVPSEITKVMGCDLRAICHECGPVDRQWIDRGTVFIGFGKDKCDDPE